MVDDTRIAAPVVAESMGLCADIHVLGTVHLTCEALAIAEQAGPDVIALDWCLGGKRSLEMIT
jgi:hypothetical protein